MYFVRKVRYNVNLNPAIVQRVDIYCDNNGCSRSELINRLLYEFVVINDLVDIPVPEIRGQLDLSEVEE